MSGPKSTLTDQVSSRTVLVDTPVQAPMPKVKPPQPKQHQDKPGQGAPGGAASGGRKPTTP